MFLVKTFHNLILGNTRSSRVKYEVMFTYQTMAMSKLKHYLTLKFRKKMLYAESKVNDMDLLQLYYSAHASFSTFICQMKLIFQCSLTLQYFIQRISATPLFNYQTLWKYAVNNHR